MGEESKSILRIKGPQLGLVVTRALWSDQITNNVYMYYVDVYKLLWSRDTLYKEWIMFVR